MIAIFDNDTVGVQALNQARTLALPDNIIATALPSCELAKAYPTTGPQGNVTMDVNGQAAGIELYLGQSCLTGPNGLRPVRWSGYVSGANAYQGEVENKGEVLQAFNQQIAAIQDADAARNKFPDLTRVWQHITSLVEQSATASALQRSQHNQF